MGIYGFGLTREGSDAILSFLFFFLNMTIYSCWKDCYLTNNCPSGIALFAICPHEEKQNISVLEMKIMLCIH